MKRYLLLLVLLLLPDMSSEAAQYEYGLRFKTYPSPFSEFTGLLLENGEPYRLRGDVFRMEFDILNRPENLLGTVFRLITDNGDNIDLMYSVDRGDRHYPILVTGELVHDITGGIPLGEWIHVSLTADPSDGQVTVDYGGRSVSVKDAGTKGAKRFTISFGYCMLPGYFLSDVASFDLRDICIYRGGSLVRHWDLSVHNGDVCLDNEDGVPARAFNPVWTVDRYISWRDVYAAEFTGQPSIAYDPAGFFYITEDGSYITVFDVSSGKSGTYPSDAGGFPSNAADQLIYAGGLVAYNLDEGKSAVWDPVSAVWRGEGRDGSDHDYYNKSSVFWEADSAIVSFGGYGHYHYNNTLLLQHPSDHSRDKSLTIDAITPRYGCSTIVMNDTLFIFGGRGNLSGKQGLSPKSYSDFHSIDLKSLSSACLWSDVPIRDGSIMSENMIYEPDGRSFYAFASYGGGRLLKFTRDAAGFEEVSLPAGLTGSSQYLHLNIYPDPEGKRLFLSIISSDVDCTSKLEIKCMDWPPVTMQLLHQSLLDAQKSGGMRSGGLTWLIILLSVIFTSAVIFVSYRAVQKNRAEQATVSSPAGTEYYDLSRNCIRFFGGFRVYDREGRDITGQFTPNLKALLILLLLHSAGRPSGISGSRINSILWSYKSEEAANNNRNVYISKLRSMLESLDGFRIVNENKLFSIRMTSGAICDWVELKALQSRSTDAQERLFRLMELLSYGSMLCDCEVEWLDSFKGDFSNSVIDVLGRWLGDGGIADDLKLRIANLIFEYDFLNEDALKAKCRILYKEGKTGIAKSVYDNFCREYSSAIGEKFHTGFRSIISA